MINNKKYSIPDGGDFNLFCRFDDKINLEEIRKAFAEHNIKVEYKINDNSMSISLDGSSSDETNVISEKYSFDEEYQEELIEGYIEDFENDDETISIFKKINSNYYFKSRNYKESVVICIFAYLLSKQTEVLLYDCFNGCYLCKNDLKSILDENK